MQNGWALQSGTSHFLGQNFARAFDVYFSSKDESEFILFLMVFFFVVFALFLNPLWCPVVLLNLSERYRVAVLYYSAVRVFCPENSVLMQQPRAAGAVGVARGLGLWLGMLLGLLCNC